MKPLEKTVWEKFTIRIPAPWGRRIREICSISGTTEAQIMRELVQIGLPIIARQTEERMEWVRGRIEPQRSRDGREADVFGSRRERQNRSKESRRASPRGTRRRQGAEQARGGRA